MNPPDPCTDIQCTRIAPWKPETRMFENGSSRTLERESVTLSRHSMCKIGNVIATAETVGLGVGRELSITFGWEYQWRGSFH